MNLILNCHKIIFQLIGDITKLEKYLIFLTSFSLLGYKILWQCFKEQKQRKKNHFYLPNLPCLGISGGAPGLWLRCWGLHKWPGTLHALTPSSGTAASPGQSPKYLKKRQKWACHHTILSGWGDRGVTAPQVEQSEKFCKFSLRSDLSKQFKIHLNEENKKILASLSSLPHDPDRQRKSGWSGHEKMYEQMCKAPKKSTPRTMWSQTRFQGGLGKNCWFHNSSTHGPGNISQALKSQCPCTGNRMEQGTETGQEWGKYWT